ncbi:MAG TPA: glutamate 5-kinase [Chthoniobacteraceae bacterium]|jgi:glutamate 5-kinase|nr:glutamate 5-kinase [Chthoniobacteraceae bacterium]
MSTQRIVLKFGSGILTKPRGNALDPSQFLKLASAVAGLVRGGAQCIVVSSGAVAAGMPVLGLKERPVELATRQACAAAGQTKLMELYSEVFSQHGIEVAQLLLTHSDMDSRMRRENAGNTLECLLSRGNVIPIINENDSVAVEELRFGDNDHLSAEVAAMAGANLLIILTSVDGLMDAKGNVVPEVRDIDAVASLVRQDKGKLSVGGMVTKLQAVRMALDAGVTAVISNGRKPRLLAAIAAGKPAGTRFPIARS